MNLELENRRVFVSASGQGIGAETATQFLAEGARVLINDTNKDKLLGLYEDLKKKYNMRVDFFVGDITDQVKITELKKHIVSKWGGVDILVANLGTGKPLTSDYLDLNEWKRFMEINVYSSIRLIKTVLPELKKSKKGSIVLMSSISGIQQSEAPFGYAAAKSSVITLVKNLSYDLAPFGIRVNAVAPGNIYFQNGRWEEIIQNKPNLVSDYIEKDVPLRRFGTPEEIASAVVFLSSPRSSFTTGACLIVDGGETRGY